MVVCDGFQTRRRNRHDGLLTQLRPKAVILAALTLSSLSPQPVSALHHLQHPPLHLVSRQNSELPLIVTNNCEETIYPAILTQGGTGPDQSGFRLDPGGSVHQNVSETWRGRVWGRTNCTFDEDGNVPSSGQGGTACSTGDCGAFVECPGAGNPPATLAEFTYASSLTQSYYDISLVDGYNLPVGIIFLPGNNANLSDIPPNLVNPICIGTSSFLTDPGADAVNTLFGTNSTYPIPLESSLSIKNVRHWCPWPLQVFPPYRPGDGVYPYPDNNIERPIFDPCLSACAKWNEDQYCCAGSYASPSKCRPSYYSTQAKSVCPDAYSYAYDDQTSTFVVPQGGGFEVVFCPTGRSSNILNVFGDQMREVAQMGRVSPQVESLASNETYIKLKNDGVTLDSQTSLVALVVLLVWMCLYR